MGQESFLAPSFAFRLYFSEIGGIMIRIGGYRYMAIKELVNRIGEIFPTFPNVQIESGMVIALQKGMAVPADRAIHPIESWAGFSLSELGLEARSFTSRLDKVYAANSVGDEYVIDTFRCKVAVSKTQDRAEGNRLWMPYPGDLLTAGANENAGHLVIVPKWLTRELEPVALVTRWPNPERPILHIRQLKHFTAVERRAPPTSEVTFQGIPQTNDESFQRNIEQLVDQVFGIQLPYTSIRNVLGAFKTPVAMEDLRIALYNSATPMGVNPRIGCEWCNWSTCGSAWNEATRMMEDVPGHCTRCCTPS